ncbi:MAG: hypothetical protein HY010_21690 [Acidobacteria bacterium]|nr:hypothetical protein [Acidobacteriota bacterium]
MILLKSSRSFIRARVVWVVLVFASLVLLSGCWVSSTEGLQEGDYLHRDADITFDPSLIGTWEVREDKCTTTLTVTTEHQGYDLKADHRGAGCSAAESKPNYYSAQLFKLDDHLFLDVSPKPDDVCEMCLPLHSILLAKPEKDLLSLTPINSEWLNSALEQKTVTLATRPGDTDMLTASPKDLKAFCRRYADNREVFKPNPSFIFARK